MIVDMEIVNRKVRGCVILGIVYIIGFGLSKSAISSCQSSRDMEMEERARRVLVDLVNFVGGPDVRGMIKECARVKAIKDALQTIHNRFEEANEEKQARLYNNRLEEVDEEGGRVTAGKAINEKQARLYNDIITVAFDIRAAVRAEVSQIRTCNTAYSSLLRDVSEWLIAAAIDHANAAAITGNTIARALADAAWTNVGITRAAIINAGVQIATDYDNTVNSSVCCSIGAVRAVRVGISASIARAYCAAVNGTAIARAINAAGANIAAVYNAAFKHTYRASANVPSTIVPVPYAAIRAVIATVYNAAYNAALASGATRDDAIHAGIVIAINQGAAGIVASKFYDNAADIARNAVAVGIAAAYDNTAGNESHISIARIHINALAADGAGIIAYVRAAFVDAYNVAYLAALNGDITFDDAIRTGILAGRAAALAAAITGAKVAYVIVTDSAYLAAYAVVFSNFVGYIATKTDRAALAPNDLDTYDVARIARAAAGANAHVAVVNALAGVNVVADIAEAYNAARAAAGNVATIAVDAGITAAIACATRIAITGASIAAIIDAGVSIFFGGKGIASSNVIFNSTRNVADAYTGGVTAAIAAGVHDIAAVNAGIDAAVIAAVPAAADTVIDAARCAANKYVTAVRHVVANIISRATGAADAAAHIAAAAADAYVIAVNTDFANGSVAVNAVNACVTAAIAVAAHAPLTADQVQAYNEYKEALRIALINYRERFDEANKELVKELGCEYDAVQDMEEKAQRVYGDPCVVGIGTGLIADWLKGKQDLRDAIRSNDQARITQLTKSVADLEEQYNNASSDLKFAARKLTAAQEVNFAREDVEKKEKELRRRVKALENVIKNASEDYATKKDIVLEERKKFEFEVAESRLKLKEKDRYLKAVNAEEIERVKIELAREAYEAADKALKTVKGANAPADEIARAERDEATKERELKAVEVNSKIRGRIVDVLSRLEYIDQECVRVEGCLRFLTAQKGMLMGIQDSDPEKKIMEHTDMKTKLGKEKESILKVVEDLESEIEERRGIRQIEASLYDKGMELEVLKASVNPNKDRLDSLQRERDQIKEELTEARFKLKVKKIGTQKLIAEMDVEDQRREVVFREEARDKKNRELAQMKARNTADDLVKAKEREIVVLEGVVVDAQKYLEIKKIEFKNLRRMEEGVKEVDKKRKELAEAKAQDPESKEVEELEKGKNFLEERLKSEKDLREEVVKCVGAGDRLERMTKKAVEILGRLSIEDGSEGSPAGSADRDRLEGELKVLLESATEFREVRDLKELEVRKLLAEADVTIKAAAVKGGSDDGSKTGKGDTVSDKEIEGVIKGYRVREGTIKAAMRGAEITATEENRKNLQEGYRELESLKSKVDVAVDGTAKEEAKKAVEEWWDELAVLNERNKRLIKEQEKAFDREMEEFLKKDKGYVDLKGEIETIKEKIKGASGTPTPTSGTGSAPGTQPAAGDQPILIGGGEDEDKMVELKRQQEDIAIAYREKIKLKLSMDVSLSTDPDSRGQAEGSLGFVGNMVRGVGSVSYGEEVFREMVRVEKGEAEKAEKGEKWKVYGKGKYKYVTLEGTEKSPGEYKDSQVGGVIGVTKWLREERERGFVIGAFVGIDGHSMTQKKKVYKKEEKEKEKGGEAVTPAAEEGRKELEVNVMRMEDSKGKVRSVVLGMCGGYIDPNFEVRMLLRGRINKYEVERLGNKVFMEKEGTKFSGKGIGGELEGKYRIRVSDVVVIGPWIGIEVSQENYDGDDEKIVKDGGYGRSLLGIGWEARTRVGEVGVISLKAGYRRLLSGEVPKIKIGEIADSKKEKYKKNKEIEGEGIEEGKDVVEVTLGLNLDLGKGFGTSGMVKYTKAEHFQDIGANLGFSYKF
ncbi:MAG: autotransporter domain-containing protein [Endomicrobium sp.]|jgi:hypothetical protein|nr:autotransporter domain-containing protein [Endomicrobium sp.]